MFRLILIVLLMGTNLCAQQTILPYFRDGKWGLIDTTGKVLTNTNYEYIHTFDQAHTTFYASQSKYGILSDQGKELSGNEFDDIVQLGHGKYNVKVKDSWVLISFVDGKRIEILKADETTFEPLSDVWLEMNTKGKKSFVNLISNKIFPAPKGLRNSIVWQDYLILEATKGFAAYEPDGDTLAYDFPADTGFVKTFLFDYEMVKAIATPEAIYAIDNIGLWKFPPSDNFYCFDNEVFIQLEQTGKLYNRSNRSLIVEGPYTYITSNDANYWYVSNDQTDANNLLSKKTKKLVFPSNTESFFEIPQGYLVYALNGFCTVYDKGFKPLIPGKYGSIRFIGTDLAYTYLNSAIGLYSLRANKYILPTIYSEISNTKDRYKGIFKDNYTIVQIDKNHKIINRIDGKNNLYVPTYTKPERSEFFDPRLFSLGWYVDSSQIVTKGDKSITIYKWGLKNESDSIIKNPFTNNLHYVIGPFAFTKTKEKELTLLDKTECKASFLQFYTNNKGNPVGPTNILWCDTLDFMKRSFMRVSTLTGNGFLKATGSYKAVQYIQMDESPILRYCYDGETELTEDKKDKLTTELQPTRIMGFRFTRGSGRSDGIVSVVYTNFYRLATQYRNKYPKAKWNYLDVNGNNLFEEPFDFAFEFVGSCAIAIRNGKWGVVSRDSIVIPFIYKNIERVIKGSDTLFITELLPKGNRYLDTTLNQLNIKNHIKSSGELNIVQIEGQQHIWNSGYTDIVEPQVSFKLYNRGYFSFKKDKLNLLHDSTGRLVCSTKRKIDRILGDTYFVFEDGNSVGVSDFSDSEVLAPAQVDISELSNSYLLNTKTGSIVYDKAFKPILSIKKGTILIDPVSGKIAHLNNNDVILYSTKGKKLSKLKDIRPMTFHNDAFLIKSQTLKILDLHGDLIHEITDMEGSVLFQNNWYCIKSDKSGWLLFNEEWKQVQPDKVPVRHIYYHGGNTFSFWDKSGQYAVVNYDKNKKIENLSAIEGRIEEGSLLVKRPGNAYYVNEEMEPINRFHYLDAKAYKNGYAAVKDSRGWTLVDRDSKPVTYPSFPAIHQIGPNLYLCQKQSVFGMYNSQGNHLIPDINERMTFIKPTIIQCITMGEIFYYTKEGKKLF